MNALDQMSSVGLTTATGTPSTSTCRACANHSSPTGIVPFADAKMRSKNCSPLRTLAIHRSSSISIA
jgi:hypothetical protein